MNKYDLNHIKARLRKIWTEIKYGEHDFELLTILAAVLYVSIIMAKG